MDVVLFSQRLRRILAGEEGTMLDGAKEQIQNLHSEIEIMLSFLNEHPYMFQADEFLSDSGFEFLIHSEDEYEDHNHNIDEPADDKEGQHEVKKNKREDEEDEKDADDWDNARGKDEEGEGETEDKEGHLEDKGDDQGKVEEDERDADDKEDHFEDKDDDQGKVEEDEGETNQKEDNVEDKDDDQGKIEEDEREAADKEHHFEDKDDDQDKDDKDQEDADDNLDEKAVKRKMLGLIQKMVYFVRKCEKAIDTCIINTLLQLQQETETESNCKELCLSLHDLQRNITPNIKRRIQQVLQVRSIQNQTYNSSPSSGTVQSDRELINGKPCVEGLEDKMEELLDLLIEGQPQLSFIGLVGDTDLEKATFAAQAYNSNYVKNYFDCHAWVLVGPDNNSNKVLNDLMKCVMPSSYLRQILEKDFQQKKIALRDYLRNKRYIIVLEEIWDTDRLDDLKEALPDFHNGSRVLTTVGDMMILDAFNFENGEKFSLDRIPLTGPVKLTYHDWHFIILKVGSKLLEEIYEQYSDSNIVQLFRFDSYYSLPFYLKPCLLYFAVFFKGIEISTRQLYQLWIAEDFIPDNNVATAERYLEELICRGLLHVKRRRYTGEVKTLYIPSVRWFVSLFWACKVEFWMDFRFGGDEPCNEGKFCFIQKDPSIFVSSKHYGPYLRSLLCLISIGDHPKDCNYISKNFKLLRVLDLGTLILEQCPHGIENLLLLRYLKLNIPSLTTMPSSLCNLLNLLTLDMPSSKIDHTPEDIWKMLKLKHLYFYFINLPAHPGRFCNSLKDLNFISTLHASSCTRDIFVRLPNLQSLRIFGNLSSYQSVMSNSLSELLYLESLKLVNETNISHNSSIILGEYQFPPRLTHLSLSNTELKDDPMPTLEKLPNLQVLKLKHNSYVGRKMGCSPGGFTSLKVLHLKSMLWLEEWTIGTGAMSKLECLIINPCAYLRKLPEELWYIKSFQKLELWWPQPELKKRLTEVEDKEWYDIQIYPFGV